MIMRKWKLALQPMRAGQAFSDETGSRCSTERSQLMLRQCYLTKGIYYLRNAPFVGGSLDGRVDVELGFVAISASNCRSRKL
jgi:hypothetical protein